MGKPEDIAAEKAVFAFEARIQGGEFEGLDPNGSEARDALKSEIRRAILSAVKEEREECATLVEGLGVPRVIAKDRIMMLPPDLASAIRNHKGA